ncbi:hypothetical protein [Anaeromyxobacter oryzae]|uniref:hypothetical protein n=1 Tax=Anaeromyxobacter oryzae TaxID=2918170 RepID=UPI0020C0078A|nr:hypothetical protein [Anaeromyxobacter oryzae]
MPRSVLVWAILWSVFARAAFAQPMGDPTPGTLAPLVVIVNPMDGGVVGQRIRVEARVQHPLGLGAIASVRLSIAGASTSSIALVQNARYAGAGGSAIYEATVALLPGTSTLVATATDTEGRATTSAVVSVVANAGMGDGNLLVRDNSSQLCTACHVLSDHGSETLGRAYGAWTTTCRDCHAPHGTRNVELIRETIKPPFVTGTEAPPARPVRIGTPTGYSAAGGVANPGLASFANGDGSGPCQVCHTRTSRWRSGGTPDAVHVGRCGYCHRHEKGFSGRCQDCHPTPPSTGAHAAHHGPNAPEPPFPTDERPFGCGTCHPTSPDSHGNGVEEIVLNPSIVLPGGTQTTGAQSSGSSTATSCLVACHYPLGAPAPSQAVTWSAAGPLPCTSCHSRINPGGAAPTPRAGPSLHDPIFSEARPASGEPTSCWSCHEPASHDAKHTTGNPGLVASSAVNLVCVTCHSPPSGPGAGPQGQVLHHGNDAESSATPPVLPGWSEATQDSTSGDFHGGRRGTCFDPNNGPVPCAPGVTPTGYGGTLRAPYYRGYPAMPCTACHAGHASRNSFLFASTVNGVAVPANAIDRTGVGAERLCEACHAGGRHERCAACHTDAMICDSGQCWMDPSANHVDPAGPGTACFYCHGHEGIRFWTEPYSGQGMSSGNCAHCHGFSIPAPRYDPPRIATWSDGAPRATGVTWAGATISWTTDEAASSWLEFGVGLPGWVAGSADLVQNHSVTLSGLTPGTTYVWRVRSADAQRNVLRTPISTFTTTSSDAPPRPDVVPVGWTGVTAAPSMSQALQWYPVTGPSGNTLEYRVQLGSDATFTWLASGAPPDSGWIAGAPGTNGGKATLSFVVSLTNLPMDDCVTEPIPSNTYYWRVKARDAVTRVESDWSVIDVFQATSWDSGHCGY